MAKTSRKNRIDVKDLKFRNDPMIRLYDRTQDWLQEKGRPVLIGVYVLIGAVILYTAGHYFFKYQSSKAAAAFAQAFSIYNAPVLDATTTNQPSKYYTDEKTKWQESADAFERLANEYSGDYGAIGRYYAGVSYLRIDRDRGVQLLQQAMDKGDQQTSALARLALAEDYVAHGDYGNAVSNYQQLVNSPYIPQQVVQLALGRAAENAGDTAKAIDYYFEVARADRSTGPGGEAEKRLSALAPERVKELPPPSQELTIP